MIVEKYAWGLDKPSVYPYPYARRTTGHSYRPDEELHPVLPGITGNDHGRSNGRPMYILYSHHHYGEPIGQPGHGLDLYRNTQRFLLWNRKRSTMHPVQRYGPSAGHPDRVQCGKSSAPGRSLLSSGLRAADFVGYSTLYHRPEHLLHQFLQERWR